VGVIYDHCVAPCPQGLEGTFGLGKDVEIVEGAVTPTAHGWGMAE
jgi:hypothetical protein